MISKFRLLAYMDSRVSMDISARTCMTQLSILLADMMDNKSRIS